MPLHRPRLKTRSIGNVIAPPRFIAFGIVLIAVASAAIRYLGWRLGFMIGFDVAALTFLSSCWGLLDDRPSDMRANAKRNDANRAVLLALSFLVILLILTVVVSEGLEEGRASSGTVALISVTLVLAWFFSNTVYTIHYAHLYYFRPDGREDAGGLRFPETEEPKYWDFIYFAFCLGMTFQTADVDVTTTAMRRAVTFHCLAAFIFNIGILAFSINVLSG